MRLFSYFFSSAQSKLKQPLLSINSDDSVEIKIDMETKTHDVETILEQLNAIEIKLIKAKHSREPEFSEAKIQSNILFSQFNFCLSAITSYGFYLMVPVIKNLKALSAQAFENYYYHPINNQTCGQMQEGAYCKVGPPINGMALINVLAEQVNTMLINSTQVCEDMVKAYCDLRNTKNWAATGAAVTGIIAISTLIAGLRSAYYYREKDSCFFHIKPQKIASRYLNLEEKNFLEGCGVSVMNQKIVDQVIDEISEKRIDLRIREREYYAPTIFKVIVKDYLNKNDARDADARDYLTNSF